MQYSKEWFPEDEIKDKRKSIRDIIWRLQAEAAPDTAVATEPQTVTPSEPEEEVNTEPLV
jgi:hypothetical protein